MKTVVLGGTGHIGTYLVPRLVALGLEVTSVSRQQREPYQTHGAWRRVKQVTLDRAEAEAQGTFGEQIAALEPDIVIDLICFTPGSNRQLIEALRGRVQHFLHCGTIWVHGHGTEVPTTEAAARRPFGDYGVHKAQIEAELLQEARQHGFPATVLHPGHIVGPGWTPLNPAGNFNPEVFATLKRGDELALPNFGLETVHHVHADDVAQGFERALSHWQGAVGESFHIVSPAALTLRGYAEAVAGWFGHEAKLTFMPFEAWHETVSKEDAGATWEHIARSPSCSIEKARRLLAYKPRYSSLQGVHEALTSLIERGALEAS
jgi:nucleoside-diphosphate-sugar epimerase